MIIKDLYNKTLLYSRNRVIFELYIDENLNNKIFSLFSHASIFFNNSENLSKEDKQLFFDYIFNRIEIDFRELGHGDMSVNSKMKILLSKFYSLIVDFRNFSNQKSEERKNILKKYFMGIKNIDDFSDYFNLFLIKDYKNIDLQNLNDIS